MMNCRWTKLFTSNILLTWHFISSADSERLQICSNFVVHPLIIEIILAPRETLFKLCDKYHRTPLSISSDDGTKVKKYLASCSTRRDMTLNLPTDPNFFEQLFNVLDPVRIPKNAPRKNHEYSRVRYLNWLNIFERKCLKLFLFLTSFVGNLKLLSYAWLIFSIQRLLQQIFGKNRSLQAKKTQKSHDL